MKEAIKRDLLNIVKKASKALIKEDTSGLDKLSDETVQYASIYQNKESVQIAVVVYALAKIVHRTESNQKYWNEIKEKIKALLKNAELFLEQNNEDKYNRTIKNILQDIGDVDKKLKLYIDDVLDKARIVKGSKLYQHGVSIGRAAELLGISQWELMGYVGKTKIVDEYKEEVIPANVRMEYAKKLFGV